MVLTDAHIALMTPAAFDALPEYSCSVPTGQAIGKRWKRDNHFNFLHQGVPPPPMAYRWMMGEYKPHPDPGYITTQWLPILVVE